MAFQIIDDVLDFTGKEGVVGKTLGNDLRQNVVTLPLIYWHEANPQDDRVERVLNQDPEREQLLAAIVSEVGQSPAIGASLAEAAQYIEKAKALLDQLPPNNIKSLMCEVADFVIQRKS
jgi:heptaprenyl diphosphate synthase component 2